MKHFRLFLLLFNNESSFNRHKKLDAPSQRISPLKTANFIKIDKLDRKHSLGQISGSMRLHRKFRVTV